MPETRNRREAIRKGDRVRLRFGQQDVTGVVSEDHGPLGVGGRRLFQVRIPSDPFEDEVVEVSEEEVERVTEIPTPSEIPKGQITQYFKEGGLVLILQSNLSGGRNQPTVWLCTDHSGNVTHTFIPERGIVGGARVPFYALHDEKVFTPKRGEVLTFLRSFGLNQNEAEDVLAAVGTAP